MNFLRPSEMLVCNCIGVVPAACTSFSRGREIFPSGRTGTEREMSGSFQTLISSTSSGPITYSVSAAGAMASETGFFAGCFCPPAARTQRGAAASTRKRIIHVLFFFFIRNILKGSKRPGFV